MTDELRKHMQTIGRKGGKKIATRGSAYFSQLGKKGMKKRWSKPRKHAQVPGL